MARATLRAARNLGMPGPQLSPGSAQRSAPWANCAAMSAKTSSHASSRRCRNRRSVGYHGLSARSRRPAPVAMRRKGHPDRGSQPAAQMRDGRVRSDRQIEVLDYCRGVQKRAVGIQFVSQLEYFERTVGELLAAKAPLQAHEAHVSLPRDGCKLQQRHRTLHVEQVVRVPLPTDADPQPVSLRQLFAPARDAFGLGMQVGTPPQLLQPQPEHSRQAHQRAIDVVRRQRLRRPAQARRSLRRWRAA